jgi:hypothetical protein
MAGIGKLPPREPLMICTPLPLTRRRKPAVFFGTYHARHTGEGGPVPPTNKETNTHYVYVLTMNGDDKVARMIKVWNAPWAMNELGWM